MIMAGMRQTKNSAAASGHKAPPLIRNLKGIFLFLVAVVVMSSLSPLVLLDQLIRGEERAVTAQVQPAIDELRRAWQESQPDGLDVSDLGAIVQRRRLLGLRLATLDKRSPGGQWRVIVAEVDGHDLITSDTLMDRPPEMRPELVLFGGVWRAVRTRAATWSERPVTIGTMVAAPTLGRLRTQMRAEMWLRGLSLLAFTFFTVLFYRSVLMPFHDMRRRSAALVDTGILPPAPGGHEHDPEYVMATFDTLVTRLLGQTDELRARAAESERQARSLERFNDYILSSLSTGVIILDRGGEILRFNRAAERTLKIDEDGIIRRHYTASHLPDPLMAVLRDGLEEGRVYARHELEVTLSSGGNPLHLGVNTSRIRNESGDAVGLSMLLTDLTAIKKLREEVAENQRLADLGELTAGLAHQLRNSMTAIYGYGKMLRRCSDEDGALIRWIDPLLTETREANDMISRFLDFARPLRGEKRPIDLGMVLREAITTLSPIIEQAGASVTAVPAHDGPSPVLGDELLLKQVFVNLIQNAVEAGGPGSVHVKVTRVPSLGPIGPRWTVTVSDDGPGVPENIRDQIFQPFFTTKETGTGLGLALARKIVGFHGGTITIETPQHGGSTFCVSLPEAAGGGHLAVSHAATEADTA